MRELFVWYRVDSRQAVEARRQVRAMHVALAASVPGLQARLLTRQGAGGEPDTWMEAYALPGSPAGIDAELQAEIERRAAALAGLIEGGRHAEVFDTAG